MNLYSNAIKFSERKGRITFMIEKVIKSTNDGFDNLIVSVIDTGLGIKDVDKKKLFKLFGSVKDEKRGINL